MGVGLSGLIALCRTLITLEQCKDMEDKEDPNLDPQSSFHIKREIALKVNSVIMFHVMSLFKDAERMEKVSRRVNELETVGNNIKLLTEMLQHYSPSSSSEGERDLMKVRNRTVFEFKYDSYIYLLKSFYSVS